MKKNKFAERFLLGLALFSFMPLTGSAQLLRGKLNGPVPEDAVVSYCPDGNLFQVKMTDLNFDKDGTFTYDENLMNPTADVTIDFGVPGGYFGIHLVKGKTVEMTIDKTDSGYEVSFDGPQSDVSRYVNRSTVAFDNMRYWAPDPSEAKSNQEYRSILDREYSECVKLLPTIKDKKTRSYYAKLTDNQYKWCKLRLIMDKCQDEGKPYTSDAEFRSLLKGVDVNDPICVATNVSLTALNAKVDVPMEGNNEAYCRRQMALTDSLVTNPTLRTVMTQVIGQNFFAYGDGSGDTEKFIADYLRFAGHDSLIANSLVEQFYANEKAKKQTKKGRTAPDITLMAPDGSKVLLSKVLNSKFTYIDVWATWCGPCVKEIPHLAKLVERYKGNDKVQFISISVDSDQKAWHRKLNADHPQWPQYILSAEDNKKFSEDWGISGIPRFIMIDENGQIFNADASRPSDEKTATIIDQQIAK